MSSWRDITCHICLTHSYGQCKHWPGYPKPRPSDEELHKLYLKWVRPPKKSSETTFGGIEVTTSPLEPSEKPVTKIVMPKTVHDYFVALGKKGGSVKSSRKAVSSRINGRLGGRRKPRASGSK